MSYKATKPGLVLFYILAWFTLYCCLLGPLLWIVSFRCCVFCLLVVLVKLSLLAKWLARKTPLRKPNRGEGIVSRKPRLKSAYDFLGLLYCFIVLLCVGVVFRPYVICFPTFMARYSLFVLKVPLYPKQTNKHSWITSQFVCDLYVGLKVMYIEYNHVVWRDRPMGWIMEDEISVNIWRYFCSVFAVRMLCVPRHHSFSSLSFCYSFYLGNKIFFSVFITVFIILVKASKY